MFNLNQLVRENIKKLKPYSSARDEYSGDAAVFLDANENPFNDPFNRYPDPLQRKLKEKIARIKGAEPKQLFLGNGSDEAIDLLIRVFCEPRESNVVTIDPTYGMYEVCADINNVAVRKVLLTTGFQLDTAGLLNAADENSRLLFLCSPNNPTSNSFKHGDILTIVQNFSGIVVLDEAYIDFSVEASLIPELKNFPNLVILQTFSKAWGLAGIRLGMAFASPEIISLLNKIKYPYNVNSITQQKALEMTDQEFTKNDWVNEILKGREYLINELNKIPVIQRIYPSDANFLLVKVTDTRNVFNYLTDNKVIVRDRSKMNLCEGCLRFTIGSREENRRLIKVLKDM